MPFSGEPDLFPRRRKRNCPQCAGLASGESECNFLCCFIISHFCAKSAIYSSCLQSCLSALRVAVRSWHLWIGSGGLSEAMARARSTAHTHHNRNKITNLSDFPKVYLLFVGEEDKYNCFNLRSHKGNWIFFFFFKIQSNSDVKAFQAVGLHLNSEYWRGCALSYSVPIFRQCFNV